MNAAPAPSSETSTRKRAFHSSVITSANQSKLWPTAATGLPATNQPPIQIARNNDRFTRRVASASSTAASGGVREIIRSIAQSACSACRADAPKEFSAQVGMIYRAVEDNPGTRRTIAVSVV
ncbi:hypothetical protein S4A8_15059 [Salinisphaera sp. S4-8]